MIVSFIHNEKIIQHEVHPYQSILSLYSLLSLEPESSYFTFQNKILDNHQLSLDYYHISTNSTIQIHHRLPGGGFGDFFNFLKKHPWLVIFGIILSMIPFFGFITWFVPLQSSLLKSVFEQSFEKVGLYIAMNLGKISLYKRIKFVVDILKFFIFIIMIYVTFTLPLIFLTFTLKGKNIFDSPKNMCSPLNAATITGLILTTLYMIIYFLFMGPSMIIGAIKKVFSKSQSTDTIVAPVAEGTKGLIDMAKFSGVSPSLALTFMSFDKIQDVANSVINTILELGCKENFKLSEASGRFMKNVTSLGSKDIKIDNDVRKGDCCNPSNFMFYGDMLYAAINSTSQLGKLKEFDLYSAVIYVCVAFYEKAYQNVGQEDKAKICSRLFHLEERLSNFMKEKGLPYVPTNIGFSNQMVKAIVVFSICNFFTLMQNTAVTADKMGGFKDMFSMLRTGMTTGSMTANLYFICWIALIICGIFDIY